MPIFAKAYRARFTWQAGADGIPVADVLNLAGHAWVTCCPLCGCWHELPGAPTNGTIVTPRCLLREFADQRQLAGASNNWIRLYDDWCRAHPQARQQHQVKLRLVTPGSAPDPDSAPTAQPARRRRKKPEAIPA